MKEGDTYRVLVWDEKPIDIIIPYKVVYTVQAADAIKGDTVSNVTKPVTLETGLTIRVQYLSSRVKKSL